MFRSVSVGFCVTLGIATGHCAFFSFVLLSLFSLELITAFIVARMGGGQGILGYLVVWEGFGCRNF